MENSKSKQETLNQTLAEACKAQVYDYTYIENLLKCGAQPMGIITHVGNGNEIVRCTVYTYALECAFYHIWHGSPDNDDVLKLTELFLQYGMDITSPEEPYCYSEDNYEDPLLLLSQTINPSIHQALKLLLDKGITRQQLDAYLCELEKEIENGEACVLDMRGMYVLEDYTSKLLLIASYTQYADNNRLRHLIWYDANRTNPICFRDWNNYEVYVDTAFFEGGGAWASDNIVITVKEKTTGIKVWRFGIGIDPREAMKKRSLDLDQILTYGISSIAINEHDSDQIIKQSCKCDRIKLELCRCNSESKEVNLPNLCDYILLARHRANGDRGSIVFDTVFSCSKDRYVRKISAPHGNPFELIEILYADDGSIEGLQYRCDEWFLFIIADKDGLVIVKSLSNPNKENHQGLSDTDDSILVNDDYELWKNRYD